MKQYWNKTKVVCTLGPASSKKSVLKEMILAGMDVARFNFSHGSVGDHVVKIKELKALSAKMKTPVAILQDLPGPKIRIGPLVDDVAVLEAGQFFFLTSKKIIGTKDGASLNQPYFLKSLNINTIVYVNDGLVKLRVVKKSKGQVNCEVVAGGRIYSRKGVNCPGKVFDFDPVTDYDMSCLDYGIKAGVDFVAVSFVQRARDIKKVKDYLKVKGSNILVIAKIERKVAFLEIDQIIQASDAVMVARGDLGIEADLEDIPFLQKEIIRKSNAQGKPVITATQMLDSMVANPRPTRAEVTDIANAIIDGTDALMLSEETAIGKYSIETVKTMVKIAAKAEERLSDSNWRKDNFKIDEDDVLVEEMSRAAVDVANNLKAKAIIVPTNNAHSISWLSRFRPDAAIAGLTSSEDVFRKLILFWGVCPILTSKFSNLQKSLETCEKLVKKKTLVKKNDNVVVLLTDDNNLFSTNMMEIRKVR